MDSNMIEWMHKLGAFLVKEGALTYIVSNEGMTTLNGEENTKQLIDMAVFYKSFIKIIELKETDSAHHRAVNYKQIERYGHLCNRFKGNTEFWVYVYWKQYGCITGVEVTEARNLQFHAVKDVEGTNHFFASMGADPKTRIRKRVDFILQVGKPEPKSGAFVD